MKIVMLEYSSVNHDDIDFSPYHAFGEVIIYPRTAPEDIVPRIGDAEVVLINKCVLSRDVIYACPNLRYIGVQATGYNVVDIVAARERGIIVTNIPAYSTPSVAQHTFALLLELTNHVALHNAAVQEGRWISSPDFCFWDKSLTELTGKTIGIVGFGQIGQRVARIAEAFGMRVLAYGPHKRDSRMVDLNTLLAESDIITLHCPLTENTKELICQDTLRLMKPGVLLVNTARGGLVNESDLAQALAAGHVGGAALDVVSTEPMQPGNPLLHAPNCIITPHIAWVPIEARRRLVSISLENLQAWINGQPKNVVS